MNNKKLADLTATRGINAQVTYGELVQIFDSEHAEGAKPAEKKSADAASSAGASSSAGAPNVAGDAPNPPGGA